MAYLTIGEARDAFRRRNRTELLRKSANRILYEETAGVSDIDEFDIFLSHCMEDAEVIGGVKAYLEEQDQTVYVDWIVDEQLDRSNVTADTADLLRKRMQASKAMIFATSKASPQSKWMPWELGYFDGLRQGRIAILPLVASSGQPFNGQEVYRAVSKNRRTSLA